MTAFDDAAQALHSDEHLSRSATYFVGGAGAGVSVRVIWAEPEREFEFARTGQVQREIEADVLLADISEPTRDDELLSLNRYRVAKVLVDSERVSARLTLKAIPAP